jgi:bifunctional UDP-N-acetylglucosamine pyrophosphorylase/glucosamine-1-phosphate N-acetyltransferase
MAELTDLSSQKTHIASLTKTGVLFVDPSRLYIDATVTIAAGALIWPNVVLRGNTHIASGAEIRSGCWLQDTTVGKKALLKPHSVCEGAVIGQGVSVGPMAHLRAGSVLEDQVKVGNFVEVKNTVLRVGAKASHLSYLGDSEVGAAANVGAGTITCNYDGHRKQRTEIGEGAFIGSNTCLVAPVTIGRGAIIGAGSIITKDVPDNALAVERSPLKVLENRASRIHARNRRLAESAKDA